MPCIRETALTFSVRYLSPLKPKACAAKLNFGRIFQKFVLSNSDVMAGGHWVSGGLPFHCPFEKPVHNAVWHFSCL